MKLASMRYLYSQGKISMGINLIISVPFIIIISCLPIFFGANELYRELISIASVIVIGFGFFFDHRMEEYKSKAAAMQESFDTSVMELEWNDTQSSGIPDKEDILAISNKYKKIEPEFESLKNWYPKAVQEIPLFAARLICQRTNLWWDISLRRNFLTHLTILTVILFFILLAIALIGGITVLDFILKVIVPFLPLARFTYKQFYDNYKAMKSINSLKQKIERSFNEILNKDLNSSDITKKSRSFQDEIFKHRKSCPLIFDWFYFRYRKEQESISNYSADESVVQYKIAKGIQ